MTEDPSGLDGLMVIGAAALEAAFDGSLVDLPPDVELRFWDPDLEVHHHQRFLAGRFVEWTRGDPASGAGIDMVCTARELGALLGLPGDGPTLAGFRIRRRDTGVIEPPPPFDASTAAALSRTLPIPDASCVVGLHFTATPFGPSDVTVEITDGRPMITIGAPEAPEVEASLRFDQVLRYLAGDLGLMDMLSGWDVTGDWPQLMLLGGVVESSEFQAAADPARPHFRDLADAVQIMTTSAYRGALSGSFAAAAEG